MQKSPQWETERKHYKDQPAQAATDWLSLLLQGDQTGNCICDNNDIHTNHQSFVTETNSFM